MRAWIVTVSDHYYPDSGVGDWRGIYNKEDEALAAYEELLGNESTEYTSVFLIEIDANAPLFCVVRDSWTDRQEKHRGWST